MYFEGSILTCFYALKIKLVEMGGGYGFGLSSINDFETEILVLVCLM